MQMIHSTKPLGFSGVITATVIAGSLFALASTSTYAATTNVHSASSYGAEVKVGSVVKLGPIAVAQFGGCTTQPIGNFTASAASVSEAGLLTAGNVDSVASSTANSSTGSSEVTNVSLLGRNYFHYRHQGGERKLGGRKLIHIQRRGIDICRFDGAWNSNRRECRAQHGDRSAFAGNCDFE